MPEQMSLEDYKKKVEDCLKKAVGEKNDKYISWRMQMYEDEFPMFLKENWSPEGTASALIMGY